MTHLTDDIQAITDVITYPQISIPSQLMAGISIDDQLSSTHTEDTLQEALACSLHSTNSVTWEQVQTATSSDENLLSGWHPGRAAQLPTCTQEIPPVPETPVKQRRSHTIQGQDHHPSLPPTPMPLSTTCSSPRHVCHDSESRVLHVLACDILATRENCTQCNRMAPSQAALPPPPFPHYRSTHSSASVPTSFTTLATTTLLSSTDTQTGQLWKRREMVQRD